MLRGMIKNSLFIDGYKGSAEELTASYQADAEALLRSDV